MFYFFLSLAFRWLAYILIFQAKCVVVFKKRYVPRGFAIKEINSKNIIMFQVSHVFLHFAFQLHCCYQESVFFTQVPLQLSWQEGGLSPNVISATPSWCGELYNLGSWMRQHKLWRLITQPLKIRASHNWVFCWRRLEYSVGLSLCHSMTVELLWKEVVSKVKLSLTIPSEPFHLYLGNSLGTKRIGAILTGVYPV